MDLLVILIFSMIVGIISKDVFVEDKSPSITQIIQNLEKSKLITADEISVETAGEVLDKFNLKDLDDVDWGEFKL